jgi:ribonuclease-3
MSNLLRALTHPSYLNEKVSEVGHQGLLLMLGDSVLNMLACERLIKLIAAHDRTVGDPEIMVLRNAYISEPVLAQAAKMHGLCQHLRTSTAFASRITDDMYAELVKAVLGAVYVDGGVNAARSAMLFLLGEPSTMFQKSVKNALQERTQKLFGMIPTYTITHDRNAPVHVPVFRSTVSLNGVIIGSAVGPNKKISGERAAVEALKHSDQSLASVLN